MTKAQLPDLCIKASGDGGTIEGYASHFLSRDRVGDIVAPGAFWASIEQHRAAGTMPAMMAMHDQSALSVGVWQNFWEDDVGLFIKGKLTLGVEAARDVFELAKDGALSLSIGYSVVESHYDSKQEANILTELNLAEVSFVPLPANPKAVITDVKSLNTVRDFEQALRKDYGLSARDAKKLSAHGWSAYKPSHAIEQKQIADAIRCSANNWSLK